MKKVLRFIRRYLWIFLSGTAFGKSFSFMWGDSLRDRAIIQITVTGLTIGITFGIFF